jgi:hypothetical protein
MEDWSRWGGRCAQCLRGLGLPTSAGNCPVQITQLGDEEKPVYTVLICPVLCSQVKPAFSQPALLLSPHAHRYVASLSVDGFGPPWRLARQGLGLGPVVKVVSPLRVSRRML